MSILYEKVISKALYAIDPEAAHQWGLKGMSLLGGLPPLCKILERGVLPEGAKPIHIFGLKFPNYVGLAAGFDKDGTGWRGAASLGFGHVEVGTVTRQAQIGNERPRVWRYPSLQAIVNAYGFPNAGAEALAQRLKNQTGRGQRVCPLGINIGKSKITPLEEAHEDYLFSFKKLAPFADYLVVNISSPNTPGLRTLQDREPLLKLLQLLSQENKNIKGGPVPLLLKVAPDLNPGQLEDILSVVSAAKFSGIIATNTTITRPRGTEQCETRGGLSGKPLLEKSLQIVRFLSKSSQGKIPIIGCGGITNAIDAGRFMDEGASLVQIYSGLVFRGPGLAKEIAQGLSWRQRAWV